jgi:DnaK suppressor protein
MGKANSRMTIKKAPRKSGLKTSVNGGGPGRIMLNSKKPAAKSGNKGRSRNSSILLPEGYRPSENEPFMNERHRTYFRNKLVAWKEEIIRQNRETLHILHEDSAQHADLADRATSETDRALELRARDRQRKLIAKIDAAVARIEEGTYGYCEETGEPIGLKRLDARPIATLSLEAQERHERREKVFRED